MNSVVSRLEAARLAPEAITRRRPLRDQPSAAEEQVPDVGSPEDDLAAGEPETLRGFTAHLDKATPPGFVQLTVTKKAGGARLRLSSQSSIDGLPRPPKKCDPPDLALGDIARKGGEKVEDVYYWLTEWSRTQPELRKWFEAVRAAVGDDLRLVIWDETGTEVPWELLYLHRGQATGLEPGWLGALVAVTRKARVYPDTGAVAQDDDAQDDDAQDDDAQDDDAQDDELSDRKIDGAMLACLADDMTADTDALDRFRHHRVAEADLFQRLLDENEALAMLYVACHGYFTSSIRAWTLGQITLSSMTGVRMRCLESKAGVVFLNACHSGRMVSDRRAGRALHGFVEAFLRRGASVVIGPSGEVDAQVARRFAGLVLRYFGERPGIPVSMALRDARAEIARSVPVRDPAKEQVHNLVYAFMFLCYGNPNARVVLPLADPQDRDST
jgi:hypothetical protein